MYRLPQKFAGEVGLVDLGIPPRTFSIYQPAYETDMRRTSEDDGIPLAVKAAAIFCGSRSPLKKSPPKQGEHTRFPDHDAFDCNVHPADVRPPLTDTNHGLNPLLPSS